MYYFLHAQKLILHTRSASGAVALWMSVAIVDSTEGILLVPYVFFVTNSTQKRKEFREEKLSLRISITPGLF
jgi:hypothetical protein